MLVEFPALSSGSGRLVLMGSNTVADTALTAEGMCGGLLCKPDNAGHSPRLRDAFASSAVTSGEIRGADSYGTISS